MKTDPKTYILHLTVEEFIEALKENIPQLGAAAQAAEENKEDGPTFTGRVCYSLNETARFFQVSHKTICAWKKGWLAKAIKQNGRKIIVDIDYALKLYDNRNTAA